MRIFLWISSKFKRGLPILACLCLCLYFSVHIISGDRSYFNLSELSQISMQKSQYLDDLRKERELLEGKVVMMRADSLSVDMLEEQAGFILGYNHAADIIVVDSSF